MPTPQIAVLSLHRHPRLRYVCAEVSRATGYRFVVVTDPERANRPEFRALLRYGVPGKDGYFLPASRFLTGVPIAIGKVQGDLQTQWEAGVPHFFADGRGSYDLLSCIFFALSRIEEYDNPAADGHGRFPASASHAFRNGYLELPVVSLWARKILEGLYAHHPKLPLVERPTLTTEMTYDIDQLWAWHHRGWRGIAAGVRDLVTGHPRRALDRWRSRPDEDPFYRPFTNRETPHQRPRPLTFFWLLSDGQLRQDPNPYPVPPAQIELMRRLAADHRMGIHPSYRASEDPAVLRTECDRFYDIFGVRPSHSRQHFLRFRLPATYRELRSNGIGHDHSMGFADAIGWRAGTHLPFAWYDVEREEATGLMIHPFGAMDVTLKNYLKLSPDEAAERLRTLRAGTEPFGGPFTLLWHNSSFAPEYGWDKFTTKALRDTKLH